MFYIKTKHGWKTITLLQPAVAKTDAPLTSVVHRQIAETTNSEVKRVLHTTLWRHYEALERGYSYRMAT